MPRYAAIDIGSNSIRMEAAEVIPGQAVRVLASDREVTRLGESVFRTGSVSEEAMQYTCLVLARMADLYRKLDVVGAPFSIAPARRRRRRSPAPRAARRRRPQRRCSAWGPCTPPRGTRAPRRRASASHRPG